MKTALYYFMMKQNGINIWITCALPNCINKPDSWKYTFCSRGEEKICCKNCIWCRWIYLYEEGPSPVIDYCNKNECKIEDVEASCWRFERNEKKGEQNETTY